MAGRRQRLAQHGLRPFDAEQADKALDLLHRPVMSLTESRSDLLGDALDFVVGRG